MASAGAVGESLRLPTRVSEQGGVVDGGTAAMIIRTVVTIKERVAVRATIAEEAWAAAFGDALASGPLGHGGEDLRSPWV
jgi:hypothetical protein